MMSAGSSFPSLGTGRVVGAKEAGAGAVAGAGTLLGLSGVDAASLPFFLPKKVNTVCLLSDVSTPSTASAAVC